MTSWITRLALLVVSTLMLWALLEVGVRVMDLFAESRAVIANSFDTSTPDDEGSTSVMLPHPFLGFSGNPAHERGLIGNRLLARTFSGKPSRYYWENRLINSHGFPSQYDDYLTLGEGFHVGIFGGSVAEQLATIGGDALIRRLEERFPERRGGIRILNFAIGGFKQPQQLINLMLARLQGIRLDVVVNLDGFNEVALAGVDVASGYNPVFPSRTHLLPLLGVQHLEGVSEALIEKMARVVGERKAAAAWRSRCQHSALCGSELVRGLIGRLVLWHQDRAAILEDALQRESAPESKFALRWHSCHEENDRGASCKQTVVDVWGQSSLQMAAISAQLGAQYIHALQPNQYMEGSKTLSASEQRVAWQPNNGRSWHARAGYPLLRQSIPDLAEQGVAVLDLSMIFSAETGDIYVDTCCHFNQRGTHMVAEAIADEIR